MSEVPNRKNIRIDLVIAENRFLRKRLEVAEAELEKTIELLHIWKNQAYAYRLKAELESSNASPRNA